MNGLVQTAFVVASFVASANVASAQSAAGSAGGTNQLQMARLPQQVQRQEFPLEGEESAFKFSFLDDVRSRFWILQAGLCSLRGAADVPIMPP